MSIIGKKKFKIIPVIDILNGIAVHAIKGRRNQYAPIKSSITQSISPKDLSKAYYEKLSSEEIYIADLDSILNSGSNLKLIDEISKSGNCILLVDMGIRNTDDILFLKNYDFKIILGTETIDDLELIDKAKGIIDSERLVVSIDIKDNKILSKSKEIDSLDIFTLTDLMFQKGINSIILLDLSKVGTKRGGYNENYNLIRNKYPDLEILIGGGVRDFQDIENLKNNGFNGVLLATVLHEGNIDVDLLKEINE